MCLAPLWSLLAGVTACGWCSRYGHWYKPGHRPSLHTLVYMTSATTIVFGALVLLMLNEILERNSG